MLRASCLAFAAFAVLATPAFAASKAMQMLDTNKDGAIDIKEVDAAAAAMFDWLAQEFKMADPDKVGTLTKDEYLALVARWFSAADQDGNGKLDEDELRLPADRKLQKLLRR
jgi:Ca2+-binding EF-hand superfamily protein